MKGIARCRRFSRSISANSFGDALPVAQIGRILRPAARPVPPRDARTSSVGRAAQRQAAAHAVAHRAQHVEVGRRAVVGIAGAPVFAVRGVLQRGLDEIGQFEIVEQDVEELVLRQRERESVLAVARIGGLASAAAAARPWASRCGRRRRTPCCRATRARGRRRLSERWNCGSRMPSVGIETDPPLAASAIVRSRTALSTARLTCARVRRRKRMRLPRLLSRGLRRRSMNWGMFRVSPLRLTRPC